MVLIIYKTNWKFVAYVQLEFTLNKQLKGVNGLNSKRNICVLFDLYSKETLSFCVNWNSVILGRLNAKVQKNNYN